MFAKGPAGLKGAHLPGRHSVSCQVFYGHQSERDAHVDGDLNRLLTVFGVFLPLQIADWIDIAQKER